MKGRWSRALPVALVLVLAAAIGSRAWRERSPEAASAATRAAPPDAETRRFGTLEFSRCEVGARGSGVPTVAAWCTSFEVPENYSQPAGRKIALRIAVVATSAAAPAEDWLTFLDGGPGGAATESWPALRAGFAPLLQRRHLLLADQRGTGGSNALSCAEQPEQDSYQAEILRQQLRQCLQVLQSRADVRQYTTTAAVQDLEAVRRALGAGPLNVIGVSYGTRVAQQYAARFPASVRSLVLDGVVPNRLNLPAEHAASLEVTLKAYAALCASHQECRAEHGDFYLALHRLKQRVDKQAITTRLTDSVSGQQKTLRVNADLVAGAARLFAYSPLTAALLPAAVRKAEQGDFAPLLTQSLAMATELGDRLNQGMALSVSCAEDEDLLHPNAADESTLLGNTLIEVLDTACEIWPRGERPADFHSPLSSTIPTLLLNGEHDPVTPVRYGIEVAGTLANARVLVANGQGHGVLGAGCMPRLVREFLADLQASKLDAGCLEPLGDVPAFLTLNGAGP